MSLVVTGASGRLGRGVVDHLLERVPAEELILVTRNPESLADYAERGAAVRPGDFAEPAGLAAAFRGGEKLLLISTTAFGTRTTQHHAAIAAAAEAGVRFVAYTSFVRPDVAKPAEVPDEHSPTEHALKSSGLGWCILRNSVYAESEELTLMIIKKTGTLLTNFGEGRVGYVARDDCSAAAAAVLADPGHEGVTYDITGPEALDSNARGRIYTEILGREIEVVNEAGGDEAFAAALAQSAEIPLPAAQMFASFGAAVRAGRLDLVSTSVQDLTGRPAQTLASVLRTIASNPPPAAYVPS